MKRSLIFAAFALAATSMWGRMPEVSDLTISDFTANHDGSRLNIAYNIDLSRLPKGINNESRIYPVLKSGNDSIRLESVTVAGRNRIIQAERTGEYYKDGSKYYRLGKVSSIPYQTSVEWQPWMDNANIDLVLENVGCCSSRRSLDNRDLGRLNMGERPVDIDFQFVTPVEERVKMRNARGEAYIDFVVNTTNIRPNYRNNPTELKKIQATIDSVKSDPDTKITALSITGYASPEGSYKNNVRLAKGRTEALADYVMSLYSFPKDIMRTSYVPEDWEGLRRFVENSSLANKTAILNVIDSDLEPDAKDRKLATSFPSDYKYMLKEWYPALRHSDYMVEYEVRKYTDPAEIAKIFKTNPYKLSLRELFIYAETLDPKSKEYADVFETAAKMYPHDKTANLNAANCAMMSKNYTAAAEYLSKAGDTPQAIYARAILAAKTGDFSKSEQLFKQAQGLGVDVNRAMETIKRATAPQVEVFNDK